MYASFVDGYDVQNQRDGAVMIVWFDPTFTNISNPRSLIPGAKVQALLSITRVSALHLCTPDTPFYRTRRSIMLMRLAHIRSNVQIHVGTPIELQYILKGSFFFVLYFLYIRLDDFLIIHPKIHLFLF